MTFDAKEALRTAGILTGSEAPELTQAFSVLSREEVDMLVSLKGRVPAALPEVLAHSIGGWTTPEATQQNFEPGMLCACGLWSGSGQNAQ
ncbi:StsA-related sactipeptide RiPP [Nonomuraea sp. NPDC004580]|uniref:StsA-related sactipeptide RiPP n=1 Tax=Nonomuraea sp. NPDC004580 TaxID=3154552 RepID=UPI0033BCDE7E